MSQKTLDKKILSVEKKIKSIRQSKKREFNNSKPALKEISKYVFRLKGNNSRGKNGAMKGNTNSKMLKLCPVSIS